MADGKLSLPETHCSGFASAMTVLMVLEEVYSIMIELLARRVFKAVKSRVVEL